LVLVVIWVAIWIYLLFARGVFWMVHPSEESPSAKVSDLSGRRVVAIIPARDEAGVVGKTITSLLQQEFPGRLEVVLVDDHSSDGTAGAAREAAAAEGAGDRLNIVAAGPLPEGWTGKLWAIAEGLKLRKELVPSLPVFLLEAVPTRLDGQRTPPLGRRRRRLPVDSSAGARRDWGNCADPGRTD
jgi:cellulose synthase/poly-beta-1,6-N-acetylglucosamine synthase-like glycosyltransferase